MPLFDDEEEDDRRQRTKAPPGKPSRGAPLRPQPQPIVAPTQPVAANTSEPDLEFDFNESSSSAAARRTAAIGRLGLADPAGAVNQEGAPGKGQRATLDLAAVKAANADRQNHLDAITVKKLLRERKEEASNPELAQVDKEVGQYVTPSYAKRMAVLRKTHGDLLAGAEEAEEEYYSSLTAKPKPKPSTHSGTDQPTLGTAAVSISPLPENESEGLSTMHTVPPPPHAATAEDPPSSEGGPTNAAETLPSLPQSTPPTADVVSEYRKTKESLDAARKARREARAHRQLADSFIDEQRRLYEDEKALRMRQMAQFVRLHPELVKTIP